MALDDSNTESLMDKAAAGDWRSRERFFDRIRARLRKIVAVEWDPRLARRLDPSDVVQEAMIDVHRKLNGFVHKRPLPLPNWLWQIVHDRVIRAKRRHLFTKMREARREVKVPTIPADSSAAEFVECLAASQSTPSQHVSREEELLRLNQAIEELTEDERSLIELHNVRGRSFAEIAEELETAAGTV